MLKQDLIRDTWESVYGKIPTNYFDRDFSNCKLPEEFNIESL